MGNPSSQGPGVGPDQKYCTECGQRILRKAEAFYAYCAYQGYTYLEEEKGKLTRS